MDPVRFGRVLGFGARLAAKTLAEAVDAATSSNPSHSAGDFRSGFNRTTENQPKTPGIYAAQQAARTTGQVRRTGRGIKQGSRRFGEAVWGPFAKLSGVLWLEVTGLFFGIFALFAAVGAWKMRNELRNWGAPHGAPVRLLLTMSMALMFGYFCVTSFVKAKRRSARE